MIIFTSPPLAIRVRSKLPDFPPFSWVYLANLIVLASNLTTSRIQDSTLSHATLSSRDRDKTLALLEEIAWKLLKIS